MNNQPNDCKNTLIVVATIGLNATIGTIGLLWLTYLKIEPNAALYSLVGGFGGGLLAILSQARGGQRGSDTSQPVTVTNSASEPVPTTDTPPAATDTEATPKDGE